MREQCERLLTRFGTLYDAFHLDLLEVWRVGDFLSHPRASGYSDRVLYLSVPAPSGRVSLTCVQLLLAFPLSHWLDSERDWRRLSPILSSETAIPWTEQLSTMAKELVDCMPTASADGWHCGEGSELYHMLARLDEEAAEWGQNYLYARTTIIAATPRSD